MRTSPPHIADAVLPGRIAGLLAELGESGLTEALDLLVAELGLRSAVLRDTDLEAASPGPGGVRAVAGETSHAVPAMRVVPAVDASAATVELPVRAAGRDAANLTVVGARPSQLPTLRAVAAVLGLALARTPRGVAADAVVDLVSAADADADAAADRLHDGAVQALVVAHYAAEAATRGGDPAAARDAVQGALVELRRALWHLRPRGTGGDGLAGALGQLANRLDEAGLPALGFVLDEPLAAALSDAVTSTAYRLVQAIALQPGGDPVRVGLRREGSTAVIDIDGGLPLPDVDSWTGRARALGGSLTSRGSRTRVAVPLNAPLTRQRPKATP
jgi:hypothetical protein